MKLYELTENYNNIYDLLENEEVPVEVVEEALKGIEDNIEGKFENISKLIKTIEGQVKMFKDEEKRLKTRRTTMENKVASLKNYVLEQLAVMDRTKVQANTFVVRKQKNPDSIEVVDPTKLDKKYFTPQEPKIDTQTLTRDYKLNQDIEGVEFKPTSYHVRIQ